MTELEAAAEAVGQKVLAETDIYVGENDEYAFSSYSRDGYYGVETDSAGRTYVLLRSDDSGTIYRVYLTARAVDNE